MSARARHLLKKFGITEEQYDDLLRKQNGCCAVCGVPADVFKRRLAVDHDHHSGFIRGLLCFTCNKRIVGRHRKEIGADLLLAAYRYLIAEYPGWVVPPKLKKRKRRGKKRSTRLVSGRSRQHGFPSVSNRTVLFPLSYLTILDTYSLEELLELNDKTTEDCLEFLVEEGYIELPEIRPLDFDEPSQE